MRGRKLNTAVIALFALSASSQAADPLIGVFDRIDAAAGTFKGMTADISKTLYNALVDESDVQTGTIKLLRVKADQFRVLVDVKGGHDGPTLLALNGNQAFKYNPKTKVEEEFDITKYRDAVNQYMLLGFGTTSIALKGAYNVTYVGEEKIGTIAASHLKLVPKAKGSLKQAELWFGENGLVVQQKFLQSSGDYTLLTYSGMKPGAVPEKDLELKVPKGTIIQKDQN